MGNIHAMIFFAEAGLSVKFGSFYNGIKNAAPAATSYDIRNPLTLLAHKKMPLPRHFFISLTNPQP